MKGKRIYKRSYKPKSKNAQQDKKISKLTKAVNMIKSDIEDKRVFTTIGATNLTQGAPVTVLLNGLGQGTNLSARLGNEVRSKYLSLRMYFYNTANAFSYDNWVRIMIVKEQPALGAAISLNSLLGSATPNVYSLYNNDNREFKHRFKVLYDKSINLWSNINFLQKLVVIKKKLNFTTNYARGNTGTITDIDRNSLYLVLITEKTTAAITYVRGSGEWIYEDA